MTYLINVNKAQTNIKMKTFAKEEFTAEKVRDQVNRFQEMMYEFIKGLSALKKQQDNFEKRMTRKSE